MVGGADSTAAAGSTEWTQMASDETLAAAVLALCTLLLHRRLRAPAAPFSLAGELLLLANTAGLCFQLCLAAVRAAPTMVGLFGEAGAAVAVAAAGVVSLILAQTAVWNFLFSLTRKP